MTKLGKSAIVATTERLLSFSIDVPGDVSQIGGVKVRMAGTSDQPLWCLADVCRVLGNESVEQAVRRWLQTIPEDEVVSFQRNPLETSPSPKGGRPSTLHTHYVTEPALYRILATSRTSNAKPFQDWLYKEVLPCIRKHGGYPAPPDGWTYRLDAGWALRFIDSLTPHKSEVVRIGTNDPELGITAFTIPTAIVAEIMAIQGELIRHWLPVSPTDRPDGSIGQHWANYRRSQGFNGKTSRTAPLTVPLSGDRTITVNSTIYPGSEIGHFNHWFYTTYAPEKLYEYIERKPEWKPFGELPRASVADQCSLRCSNRKAQLPSRVRKELTAVQSATGNAIVRAGEPLPLALKKPRQLSLFD